MSDTLNLLRIARARYSQRQVASALGVSERTVARWETHQTPPPMAAAALRELLRLDRLDDAGSAFTFIDLFAGIGGIRTAFERAGGRCVFTSEWDRWAQQTYGANFPDEFCDHVFAGDITKIAAGIPDHDVLAGGFPCQPFSIAGVSKKNALGRAHGFADATQGTLFFDVARIIDEKRPSAFLLENVKNLRSHDMDGRSRSSGERSPRTSDTNFTPGSSMANTSHHRIASGSSWWAFVSPPTSISTPCRWRTVRSGPRHPARHDRQLISMTTAS